MKSLVLSLYAFCIGLNNGVLSLNYQTRPPTRFSVDPKYLGDIVTSSLTLLFRFGNGIFVDGYQAKIIKDDPSISDKEYTIVSAFGNRVAEEGKSATQPKKMIELYEFEGCPFCKKVREAVSKLDLDVTFYPCPQGGPTYRQKVRQVGGKEQFPYLIDPNTNVKMYESSDIIQYLYDTYGGGRPVPASLSSSFLNTLTTGLALAPRLGRGSKFVQAKPCKKPIEFWGYEGSPFCKIVRERLVELELPHTQRTCPRGSAKRQQLFDRTGRFQVPYIEDPNTGVKLFESSDILAYLNNVYAVTA